MPEDPYIDKDCKDLYSPKTELILIFLIPYWSFKKQNKGWNARIFIRLSFCFVLLGEKSKINGYLLEVFSKYLSLKYKKNFQPLR